MEQHPRICFPFVQVREGNVQCNSDCVILGSVKGRQPNWKESSVSGREVVMWTLNHFMMKEMSSTGQLSFSSVTFPFLGTGMIADILKQVWMVFCARGRLKIPENTTPSWFEHTLRAWLWMQSRSAALRGLTCLNDLHTSSVETVSTYPSLPPGDFPRPLKIVTVLENDVQLVRQCGVGVRDVAGFLLVIRNRWGPLLWKNV